MDLFLNGGSQLDTYYIVNDSEVRCTQFVRKSQDSIGIFDIYRGEIKWFGNDDEFFNYFENVKGAKPDQLIELDFESFLDFLIQILGIEEDIFALN